jgi:hypothetical protein
MPYTLAHAVVALPLNYFARGRIPLAAMAVGSFSPDLPYLIALTPANAPGHTLIGVLIYCLVPSLIILLVWYRLLETSTLEFFGLPKRKWLFDKLSYFALLLGVLLGAYSHVLWDATSHADGALVISSQFWNQELFSLPLYKWNQYSSGVLGLATLAVWYLFAVLRNRQEPYKGRFVIGVICYSGSIAFFVVLANVIHGSTVVLEYAVRSAIGVMVGGVFGACLYAILLRVRNKFA